MEYEHQFLGYRTIVCPVCDVGVLWPNGWTDQDETWHAGRPQPWQHCVKCGPTCPSPQNSQKSQNSNLKILVHHFLRLCLLCNVKKSTRFEQNWRRRYILKSAPIAITQVWMRHPRPMIRARHKQRVLAASTNRSIADDFIYCRQGMT